MNSRMMILIIFTIWMLVPASLLHAQTTTIPDGAKSTPSPAVAKTVRQDKIVISDHIANWRGVLLSIEQALARSGINDDNLVQKSSETSDIRIQALEQELKIKPQVKQLKVQLNQLGSAPKKDEPAESEAISAKRIELENRYSILDGNLKAIRLIVVRATQIEEQITYSRRQYFVTQISQRSKSLFDIRLWQNFWNDLDGFWHRFNLLISDSTAVMITKIEKSKILAPLLLGGMIIIAGAVLYGRQRYGKIIGHIITHSNGQPFDNEIKIQLAGASFARNAITPVGGMALLYLLFTSLGIFTSRLENLMMEITFTLSAIVIALVLTRTYLVPNNPSRRLINLPDITTIKISNIILLGVLFIGGFRLFNKTSIILASPFEVSIALRALLALSCFLCISLVLVAVAADDKPADDKPADDQLPANRNFIRWGYLKPLFWLGCVAGIISLAAGYLAFAVFLAWQILIAALVFALLWLCIEFLDFRRNRHLSAESGRWRKLAHTTGFSQQAILQGGVFGFGLVKLSAVLAAAVIFMISWGYRTRDWTTTAGELFFGFRIGGLNVSFSAIALAIVIFVTGYLITKAIQNWLQIQFLPTTALDPGLRNSIATIFGYAGMVIAVLLAVSAAGFDLSNIAIIAGALSVGIGFGLQSIVNNFFSGLILLAERPIKAGDWIVTSGGQGTVTKTSVRSTQIETFDGATVIIPNSTLITEAVTNWTHNNKRGRIIVSLGVGYDSDPEQVRNILLECGQSHKLVLQKPGPSVYFMDFGADALIFELRAYLSDINYSITVKSELRYAITSALRQAKIEIPYPQRDIHIKSAPESFSNTKGGTERKSKK